MKVDLGNASVQQLIKIYHGIGVLSLDRHGIIQQ